MATAVFMRHAKTTLNKEGKFAGHADCDTTVEGLEEAKRGFKYDPNSFDIIYCSPLKRTEQTSKAIIPDSKPIIDKRIIERFLGDWENKPYSSVDDTLIDLYAKGVFDPPNSEPEKKVKQRTCEFVEELYEKYKGKDIRILVVSHAGVLREIRNEFFPEMEKTVIKNATTFEITDEIFEEYEKRVQEKQKGEDR